MDTLLKAAEFVELSSGPKKEENLLNARAIGNHSNNVYTDRRRVVSESEATERRRRPGGAGTRETHNKLEKNRRAHLKECFDILKKQVPSLEEKKTSNLNILRGALKHIQNMKKQEQEYAAECDVLKMNKKSLEERLNVLKSNTKVKTEQKSSNSETVDSRVSKGSSSSLQTPSATTTAAKTVGDSRTSPISVATQTPSSELGTLVNDDDEKASTTRISTSSTDTGGEGDESEHKLSTCDDNEDEKTDTDEGLSFNEEDNDQDIEIDVVGGQDDDSPSTVNLHTAVKKKAGQSNQMNREVEAGEDKRKVEEIPKSRYNNIKSRKRSKSEAASKNEEDSDYDENTKEEPKAKFQGCARAIAFDHSLSNITR